MGRRREEEEHENHERWLVSYADFITLLFAFFVVMYAVSSVNEGKYRVLSDSIVQAFRADANVVGMVMISPPAPNGMPVAALRQKVSAADAARDAARKKQREKVRNMAEDIKRVLEPLVQGGAVHVTEGVHGVSVEINASVLFQPGDATLGAQATRALQAVASVLAQADFPITVEGHTDTLPIKSSSFPSNWELSAVRASSVVRLFVGSGVDPRRLTAAGYGDQRPIADNGNAEGRARNRRVTILIESMLPEVATDDTASPPDASGGALGMPADLSLPSSNP
ncbi:flagellar motor protein MotD [Viridibacterium curvum]|uniref:Flagellar motor protein MotD n=1 Tax=Viridibacterium curvum TaxID=1101404 RepID=A0ABP9R2H6_9RHOO